MRYLFFLGAIIWVLPVFGDDGRVQDSIAVHHHNVIMDPDIKWLLEAHRHAMSRERGIPGFRVQVFMEAGNQARLNTQRSRAEFENKYPGTNVYIVYEEPNFKLRVGDFRTRLDARRFLETIKEDYPAAYIVVSNINFPDLE